MPIIPQVNIQQVLQMGTHTEKVQQTIQSLPYVTGQQLNEERAALDALKRSQVQELNNTYMVEGTDPKTLKKKRVRIIKKKKTEYDAEKLKLNENLPSESHHGGNVNIQA